MPAAAPAYNANTNTNAAFASSKAFANTGAATSPFAMAMPAQTMSPDDMLRAYAKTHTSAAKPVQTMRVLYKQPGEEGAAPAEDSNGNMIRAGPGARFSR
jgi:hypothetical protein